MATTGIHGWTTPDGIQAPLVHVDMKTLADLIDVDVMVRCTSATRPAHSPGRRIFETDTKKGYVSDGVSRWFMVQATPDLMSTRVFGTTRSAGSDNAFTPGTVGLASISATMDAGLLLIHGGAGLYSASAANGYFYIKAGSTVKEKRYDLGGTPVSPGDMMPYYHNGGSLTIEVGYRLVSGAATVTSTASGPTSIGAINIGPVNNG